MAFGILSLVPELIERISREAVGNRKSLRATCRRLNQIITPQLFSRMVIDVRRRGLLLIAQQLYAYAYTSRSLALHVRTLVIGSLLYSRDPKIIAAKASLNDEYVRKAIASIKESLERALLAMRNVQAVTWKLHNDNPDWAREVLLRVISSSYRLEEFTGKFQGDHQLQQNVHFPFLSNLKRFTVAHIPAHHIAYPALMDAIAHTIGRCNNLEYLDIGAAIPSKPAILPEPTLDALLTHLSPGRILRLRRLVLINWHLRPDRYTMPHLRHLVSLTLRKNLLPRESTPTAETGHTLYSTAEENVFDNLTSAGIRLQELITDSIIPALIKYLCSYQDTLRRLELTRCTFTDQSACNTLAHEFYATALPRHRESLEILRIETMYASTWSFNPAAEHCLAECVRLHWLSMDVDDATNGTGRENRLAVSMMRATVNDLLRFSAKRPMLTRLTITPAFKNGPSVFNSRFPIVAEALDNLLCSLVEEHGPIDPSDALKYPVVEVGWPTMRMRVRTPADGGAPRFVHEGNSAVRRYQANVASTSTS
ncbi:hypothetical protein AMATHDRAFT_48793 [Amanita thiersii Skay4041]|uniref:F-box domain-containing protein n=1 Tax=Amanita thiersii Skay4041 TaxID=703135 RepID=A0A2A9NM03_9AGAR|nr:hypothetical protein AMATHDRAFT_48793 [Amanita thiersii Skay4041]